LFVCTFVCSAIPNGVALTPPMGWSSWNTFACNYTESDIRSVALTMNISGMQAVGYQYVNIDDTWSNITGRDASGRIQPNLSKFPNGIASVASHIHSLGLSFGIYSDAGTETCAGYPGSLGNEEIDAETFASWGVDYLKYDNCYVPANWTDACCYTDWSQSNSAERYRRMSDALATVSRPIEFNLCIWGQANVWTWGATVGESWRMAGDSNATWGYFASIIALNVQYLNYVDFYSHNDMDMMEIGNGNLTIPEQRTHFAAWAFLKSPILLGTDLSLLSTEQLDIIKNPELIAFSQDNIVGTPAMPFNGSAIVTSTPEYFAGKSSKGTHVFIINTSSTNSKKTIKFASVPDLARSFSGEYLIHDMWTGKDVGIFADSWSTVLESHDTGAWFIRPV